MTVYCNRQRQYLTLIEAENMTVESMVSIASTPIGASVNLVIQFALLLLLIAGGGFARMGRLKTHRRVMIIAIVVQAGTLIFWMAPWPAGRFTEKAGESEAHPSSCQKHVYKIMLIERILQGTGARYFAPIPP